MTATTTTPTRAALINALRAFIEQRPGMNPADYGDSRAYRAESREITADLHDARALLDAVERRSIDADAILSALTHRLTWDAERGELDYCTGQYFATEYRPAVARACASMLWAYWRDQCGCTTADAIRTEARRTFRQRRLRRYFA